MILFRIYAVASDQLVASSIAREYVLILKKAVAFNVKLVQPYWKLDEQYEILLESAENMSASEAVISDLVSLFGVNPQFFSEDEAIWADLDDDFLLPGTKWAHLELI